MHAAQRLAHLPRHLALHEGETVLVEDDGICIYHRGDETTWVPRPQLPVETERRTGHRPTTFVAQVIIENSAGKTTEFIRA